MSVTAAKIQKNDLREHFQSHPILAANIELPTDILSRLTDPQSAVSAIHLNCFALDTLKLELTPEHWGQLPQMTQQSLQIEQLLLFLGAKLGPILQIPSCQNGAAIQNIIPIKAHENKFFGTSSNIQLGWHTEDGFSCDRGKYLILACLKNPSETATLISSPDLNELNPTTLSLLQEAHFSLLPDESHFFNPNFKPKNQMKIPLVHRQGNQLNFRFDDIYMAKLLDPKIAAAYCEFKNLVIQNAVKVILKPGDILIIDNDLNAHSRSSFKAKYDGHDRWLKRIYVRRNSR